MTTVTTLVPASPPEAPSNRRHAWGPTDFCGMDFRHDGCSFYHTGRLSSQFVVNPEWISERQLPKLRHPRYHQPWSYEFQGARTWPHHCLAERESVDNKIRTDLYPRHAPHANYTQYRQGSASDVSSQVIVRRPESVMREDNLSSYEKDVVHPSTVLRLSDTAAGRTPGHRRRLSAGVTRSVGRVGTTATRADLGEGTQDQFATSYRDHFCQEMLSPDYVEYADHEAIPPSRPRLYPGPITLSRSVGGRLPPPMSAFPQTRYQSAYGAQRQLPRCSTVSRGYTNFVSHNWVH